MYDLLLKVSAEAVKEITANKKYVGGEVGILSVLHTWTSTIHFHPHVHMLVTSGGLDDDTKTWHEASKGFLLPVRKLSPMISEKFAAILRKDHPDIFEAIKPNVWKQAWCSYCKAYGKSSDAVVKYLARYVFRIAITNHRILKMDDTSVTFRYKDNSTGSMKTQTISGVEFIRRFMFHVLPKGFHKVRYFGLCSPAKRQQQATARLGLLLSGLSSQVEQSDSPKIADVVEEALSISELETHDYCVKCPHCASTEVDLIESKRRNWQYFKSGA